MSNYWCANCNDTTVGWYKATGEHICAQCKKPCEDIVLVIHGLQAEIGRFIIINTEQADTLAESKTECDRLKQAIEQFNEDRFPCNCKDYTARKQTKCFPWCRSNNGVKIKGEK